MDSNQIDELGNNRFTFLNHCKEFGPLVEWNPTEEAQLWRYNLNYFHYAVTLANAYDFHGKEEAYWIFRRLVREWIEHCPVASAVVWDPFPTSLRITNWIKAYTLFEPMLRKDTQFSDQLKRSLCIQSHFLETHVEHYLQGNHLIENGRALLMSGMFFSDDNKQCDASRWRAKGEKLLWSALDDQYLPDGGQYERCPMYHQIYLNLYSEVVQLLRLSQMQVPKTVLQKIESMVDWMDCVLHPDGNIALLNDSALGIVDRKPERLKKGNTQRGELIALEHTGYYIFSDRNAGNYMIFDCAPIGPDHFPGHGHCDTLSYELSLDGRRMIVDSGVGNYDGNPKERLYYRSTRAHNTVSVDGFEQSEIWDRYRVGRRAHPVGVCWDNSDTNFVYVVGAHDGYHRLSDKVTHRRWICWIDQRYWLICDSITGRGSHQIENFVHFHPDVTISHTPTVDEMKNGGKVKNGNSTMQLLPWGVQQINSYYGTDNPLQGWVAPEFGISRKNVVWGFENRSELPLWTGYVVCPFEDSLSVDHEIDESGGCKLSIKFVNDTFANDSIENDAMQILFSESDASNNYMPMVSRDNVC